MNDPSGRPSGRLQGDRWTRGVAFALLLAAATLVCLGAATAVDEVEPNGNLTTAQMLPANGSYVVRGTTSQGSDALDFFGWNLTEAAVVEIVSTSTWACSGAACENLTVVAPNGSVLIDPFGNPMTSTDVYFSGLAGSTWFLEVTAGAPGGAYTLTVTFYPFTYGAGQTVDVIQANQSSAIVAIADADLKSSTHPYDLTIEGDGLYYGYSLNLFVVNVGPRSLRVFLPSGLIWEAEDARYTDYIVTRDQTVVVDAWTYERVAFIAVSLSPFGWVPGDPSQPNHDPAYYLGSRASGELGEITDETDLRTYGFQSEQVAVWAYNAGQTSNDLDNLGASRTAKNEAIDILDRANVHTALNAKTSLRWFPLLDDILGAFPWWILCFFLFFLGVPLIVGLSQAMRVVRLRNLQIDGAYGSVYSPERRRQEREERRTRQREAREMERGRRQQRQQEEAEAWKAQQAQMQQAAAPPPVPVPAPVATPSGPVPTAATPLTIFLRKDADEHFDLDALNGLDYNAVLADAMKEKASAAETATKAEAILKRIHGDVADPDTIDDILRDRMVKWYRQSPTAPEWTVTATKWWSGLVAESRAAGGRRRSSLESRLSTLQATCASRGAWFKPKPPKEVEPKGAKGRPEPPPGPAAMKAQAVQAVLEDLAAAPRKPDSPTHPLPVLSELAARFTSQRVNQALAEMFKADVRGPYVVMHPSRYPDADVTAIRPPAQGARAGAAAYELVFIRSAPQSGGVAVAGAPSSAGAPVMLDITGALWERPTVTKPEWTAVLGELSRSRNRLDPPPSNYRRLPPYFALRELMVESDEGRRAFLAVKWRGKPVGIGMLVQLLVDRTISMQYDTDREYFEAELADLERGDPSYQSPTGTWALPGGLKVTREGDSSVGYTYKL